jgi:hypothetical protein
MVAGGNQHKAAAFAGLRREGGTRCAEAMILGAGKRLFDG